MIYTSPIISQASGVLGDAVFYSASGVQCVRTRVAGANPQSPQQMEQRNQLAALTLLWRQLSESERDSWRTGALSELWYNRLGEPFKPSGFDLFVSRNRNAFIAGSTSNMTTFPGTAAWVDWRVESITIDASQQLFSVITSTPPSDANWLLSLQTSPPQSPGRRSRRRLRLTALLTNATTHHNIWGRYVDTWQELMGGESIGITARLLYKATGQAQPAGNWFVLVEPAG